MDQEPIMIEAIETNVRTLIKSHPRAANFIKTLQNEAIDQAFQEITDKLYDMEQKIDFLEKRTHHLAPKIEE